MNIIMIKELLMLKSGYISNLYNDEEISDEVMGILYEDSGLNEEELILILNEDIDKMIDRYIIKLWGFLHKYDIKRDNIKSKLVKYKYGDKKMEIREMNVPMDELLIGTCINCDESICQECHEAAENGHIECLKYFHKN